MEAAKHTRKSWSKQCGVCNVNFTYKDAFVLHLLGKRHQKNVRKKHNSQGNSVTNRTVCFAGKRDKVTLAKIVGFFLEYGIKNVSQRPNIVFIEFDTVDAAKVVLQKRNYKISTTFLRVFPMEHHNGAEQKVRLSSFLKNRMSQPATGSELNKLVQFLVKEIEMKPREAEDREILRRGIVNYLSPYFPKVIGYIFGSSASSLGFTGCDVDIYLDVGLYPWNTCETKAAAQAQARDITWFLADKIRASGKAVKISAIPRARVPIVKFQDRSSGILVDLSFRHGMPVYNTQLIYQYTQTHPLVRPYMMVIRYWAKLQDVAGGGKPSCLITNYALSMMMLFYLMYREDPIVPSVSFLRSNRAPYAPVFIDRWDVGFSTNTVEWHAKVHKESVMDVVAEFFSFYGELEASRWVISPLTGTLLAKEDVRVKSNNLPECLNTYKQQGDVIELDRELCVQDPFEHSHNCTRGLHKSYFLEFQFKCRKAAEISKNILKGEQTFSDLFQPIENMPDVVSDVCQDSKEDSEVITLDDSDTSQDVEVLDSHEETVQDSEVLSGSEGTSDVEILPSPERKTDGEILFDVQEVAHEAKVLGDSQKAAPVSEKATTKQASAAEEMTEEKAESGGSAEVPEACKENCNEAKCYVSASKGEGSGACQVVENCTSSNPVTLSHLGVCSTFSLDYTQVPEFMIASDGNVYGKASKLVENYDTGQAACFLIQFILEKCLKIEVSTVENCLSSGKRKALMQGSETSRKKIKKQNDEGGVSAPAKYIRLTKHMCLATLALWNGRKKVSKTVLRRNGESPLHYELATTEAQINKHSYCSSKSLKFTVEVLQELENPKIIHVAVSSSSDAKTNQSQMIPMFSYFSSLCQNLLKKLTMYVKNPVY